MAKTPMAAPPYPSTCSPALNLALSRKPLLHLLEEPRSALKENNRVGLVCMRLDRHLPKLYPRAHANVGACHERRYSYGCDLVLPRLGQGSFWRLKTLKVDASDKADLPAASLP